MRKVALYARVSTERQEKEGTIQSQVSELKRQIERSGDVLVKEYVDNGHSGASLDRPAMEAMRTAFKTDEFEAVYFLSADRVARTVVHQNIIISELLQNKKRIIIAGKDYEQNPENEFALTVFGAVSQFERAKIIERMRRGWLHKLRNGELSSHGQVVYGYHYIQKTPTSKAELVINEKEAEIILYIFEQYASGAMGLCAISRSLEQRGIPTRRGRPQWKIEILRRMITNESYVGIKYYNRIVKYFEDITQDGLPRKVVRIKFKEPSEWISVKVPRIVPQELFDKANERLRQSREKYRKPKQVFLLNRFVRCGECGKSFCSKVWYEKRKYKNGELKVKTWSSYKCSTRFSTTQHDLTRIKRCHNSQISTSLLDEKVLKMIQSVMFDPAKLSASLNRPERVTDSGTATELVHIAEQTRKLAEARQKLTNGYALGRTNRKQYVERNRFIDSQLKQLETKKALLANSGYAKDVSSEKSIRQFCSNAKSQFESGQDLESKRKFFHLYIERIIFTHGRVAVVGSVPITDTKPFTFRIEGLIDDKRSRLYSRQSRSNAHLTGVQS